MTASGNLNLTSGANTSLQTGSNLDIAAGHTVRVKSGGVTSITPATSFGVTAGSKVSLSAGTDAAIMVKEDLRLFAADLNAHVGAAEVSAKKDGTVAIKGRDITLEGSGKINIKASSDVILKGSNIKRN